MSAAEPPVLGDRYVLEQLLGRGGMADVWRATDRVLSRGVAVKVLRDTTETGSDRARFVSEASTLARLSHPSLVMLFDAGVTGERPFLVLELVEGTTLDRELTRSALPEERVREIGSQLASALAFAHQAGVVHRDVKPGNVLLGPDGRVKLADFGIARLIGDTVRHTGTGQAIGTAAYLSPEQVQGMPVGPDTDVYSLGLVLLEALTGERAFPGPPTEAALARLQRGPNLPTWLPLGWRGLLLDLTGQQPAERPSAADVAARLEQLDAVRTHPVDVTPTRPLTTTGPAPSPMPAAAAPVAVPAAVEGPDAAERAVRRAGETWSRTPMHIRAVLAVLLLIFVLVVVAAVAARSGTSGGGGDGGSGGNGGDGIPTDTPPELRGPLRELHDAVEGTP